jgi:hypothetical protein
MHFCDIVLFKIICISLRAVLNNLFLAIFPRVGVFTGHRIHLGALDPVSKTFIIKRVYDISGTK